MLLLPAGSTVRVPLDDCTSCVLAKDDERADSFTTVWPLPPITIVALPVVADANWITSLPEEPANVSLPLPPTSVSPGAVLGPLDVAKL